MLSEQPVSGAACGTWRGSAFVQPLLQADHIACPSAQCPVSSPGPAADTGGAGGGAGTAAGAAGQRAQRARLRGARLCPGLAAGALMGPHPAERPLAAIQQAGWFLLPPPAAP